MSVATEPVTFEGAIADLISPIGGVVASLDRFEAPADCPSQTIMRASLGDVDALHGGIPRFGVELDGLSCHDDPEVAARVALMEALERYAAAAPAQQRWVTGAAIDVGADALEMSDAARCCDAELASDDCPLVPWDETATLRWTRGWSLVDGRDVWVPAVMAHLGVAPRYEVERFWLQTSSGCAIGTSEQDALLAACFELIERDAIAISWLQRLALPWILDADVANVALFDATTDLELPTVMAVHVPPQGSQMPAAVGAACSDSRAVSVAKALREVTLMRAVIEGGDAGSFPDMPAEAFEHLRTSRRRTIRVRNGVEVAPTGRRLENVVKRLARVSRDVVAVDLTPVELAGTGLHAVRVIAPALVPYLAHPQVRYCGSRRLYDVPAQLGYRAAGHAALNPWRSPLW